MAHALWRANEMHCHCLPACKKVPFFLLPYRYWIHCASTWKPICAFKPIPICNWTTATLSKQAGSEVLHQHFYLCPQSLSWAPSFMSRPKWRPTFKRPFITWQPWPCTTGVPMEKWGLWPLTNTRKVWPDPIHLGLLLPHLFSFYFPACPMHVIIGKEGNLCKLLLHKWPSHFAHILKVAIISDAQIYCYCNTTFTLA